MIDIAVLILLCAALGVIVVLAVRKFPIVAAIDVEQHPLERHAQMKTDLMAQRLQRKLTLVAKWLWSQTGPVARNARVWFQKGVAKLIQLEEQYRHKARTVTPLEDNAAVALRVDKLLDEAATLRKEASYEHAEQHYIEAIGLVPSSVKAFQGLGELYLEQKEYAQAQETLTHALKLAPESDSVLLDLATTQRAQGDVAGALKRCQQAVQLQPNDPKNLDALLDVSIAMSERELAERTLEQLATVNPENQKLATLREQVEALPPNENGPVRKQVNTPL